MLSILDILEDTTVDGPGFRTAIYAAGCPNGCPGCHNPESWDINRGHWMSTEEILEKILADISFDASEKRGSSLVVDREHVVAQLADVRADAELSRFIL